MAYLNLSHEQIRAKLFSIPAAHQAERDAAVGLVIHLSDIDDWYPESLRRELQKLESAGTITQAYRHAVEHGFFPERGW